MNTAKVIRKRSCRLRIISREKLEQQRTYLILKRMMDVLCAMVGMIVLSPLFLVIAIIIKIENVKGPVFFKQKRIGKNGKEFYMYKFRSMVVDAEEKLGSLLKHNEVSGAMFKMKQDPRITRIGRFIRKTSLDELPQLLNVLQGHMSLVGPRPPLPREVNQYTTYHMQRLLVTPGCTGLWQVSGRNSLSFEEMVQLDVKYIQRRSILFDITIIMKTIRVMLTSNDAY